MSPLIHQVEHIADVHTNAASQTLVEVDVRAEAVPVAIEGKTNQLALAVEHRATRVTAGNIVVGKEAELHLASRLILILAEILLREKLVHDRLSVVIDYLIALLHLLNEALGCGIIA